MVFQQRTYSVLIVSASDSFNTALTGLLPPTDYWPVEIVNIFKLLVKWKDYEVIDCSGGEKLERWGDYILVRPDPQVIWNTPKRDARWRSANMTSLSSTRPCRTSSARALR